MKKNKFLALIIFFIACSGFSCQKRTGLADTSIREGGGIFWEDVGGGCHLLVVSVPRTDWDERIEGAQWFVVDFEGAAHFLGEGFSSLYQVEQVLASPDKKYLAVLCVGEGHPVVEVVDLKLLVAPIVARRNPTTAKPEYKVLYDINPYPGGIWMKKWEGDRLILGSDMLLTRIEDENFSELELDKESYPDGGTFALGMGSGEINEY